GLVVGLPQSLDPGPQLGPSVAGLVQVRNPVRGGLALRGFAEDGTKFGLRVGHRTGPFGKRSSMLYSVGRPTECAPQGGTHRMWAPAVRLWAGYRLLPRLCCWRVPGGASERLGRCLAGERFAGRRNLTGRFIDAVGRSRLDQFADECIVIVVT